MSILWSKLALEIPVSEWSSTLSHGANHIGYPYGGVGGGLAPGAGNINKLSSQSRWKFEITENDLLLIVLIELNPTKKIKK